MIPHCGEPVALITQAQRRAIYIAAARDYAIMPACDPERNLPVLIAWTNTELARRGMDPLPEGWPGETP